jgi:hypothetical protein
MLGQVYIGRGRRQTFFWKGLTPVDDFLRVIHSSHNFVIAALAAVVGRLSLTLALNDH